MQPLQLAGIGEILWDVIGNSEVLGGAPVNFAYHASALGAKSYAVSAVGQDSRGDLAIAKLRECGVNSDYIKILPEKMTGFVTAKLDEQGVATYNFPADVAWDHLQVSKSGLTLAKKLDAICFGSLAQRSSSSKTAIYAFLRAAAEKTLKVFDLNIRQQFYTQEIIRSSLELCDVLKLNDEEITLLGEMEQISGDHVSKLQHFVDRYSLKLAVLTRGGNGSLLVSPTQVSEHTGCHTKIVDTIGAGDSFTTATIVGFLSGRELEDINDHANRVAAFVCSQKGAMPLLPTELRQL